MNCQGLQGIPQLGRYCIKGENITPFVQAIGRMGVRGRDKIISQGMVLEGKGFLAGELILTKNGRKAVGMVFYATPEAFDSIVDMLNKMGLRVQLTGQQAVSA